MKPEVLKKKIITNLRLELYPMDLSIGVIYEKQKFYISRTDWKALSDKDPFEAITLVPRYLMYSNDLMEKIHNEPIHLILDDIRKMSKTWGVSEDPSEIKLIEDKLYRFSNGDYEVFKLGRTLTYPVVRQITYIEGLDNVTFDLDKAQVILSKWVKLGVVKKVEQQKIPYYNAYGGRTHGLLVNFTLTDEQLTAFSGQSSRDVLPRDHKDPNDPLGLLPAMRTKKEQEKIYDDYNDSEDGAND